MSDRPKILFVINSPIIGGAERHTLGLAEGLRDRGFATLIFAIKNGPEAARHAILAPKTTEVFSLRKRLAELRDLITRDPQDIIVGINERPIVIATLAKLATRGDARIVGLLHSTSLRNAKEYLVQFCHFPFFYALDMVIFISARQKKYWARLGLRPRHPQMILNGIDVDKYSDILCESLREPARQRLGFAAQDIVLALSAVFRPEKNHGQLLEAVAEFRAEGRPVKALFIGDGPRRAEIEARAKALRVAESTVITGFQPDVRPFIAAADIGVNCSTSIETMSLSALEMLGMGLPMVMSDIGGASEMIDGRNGTLFKPGDSEGLRQAISGYFDPAQRARAGHAARARVVADFDQNIMLDRYARAFSELLPRRGKKLNSV